MAKLMTIDASAMASFNYSTFLSEYFAPTTATSGTATWLDAKAEMFMNMPFYYPADEASIRFGTDNDRGIILEGENMGYDVSGFHTYYAEMVNAIRFAYWDAGTVYAQGNNERSEMIGVIEGVVIKGLDMSVGKATTEAEAEELASNAFYDLYNSLRHANGTLTDDAYINSLYDLFASKGQRFIGSEGDDIYVGTKFADKIDGGVGFDTLTGGKGKDIFIFNEGDTTADIETADIILDFNVKQDTIKLKNIDANVNKDGDQAFTFLGKEEFTGKAGQAIWERANGDTIIRLDTDGDAVADYSIVLDGKIKLDADLFVL